MDKVIEGFLDRNLPAFNHCIEVNIVDNDEDAYSVRAYDGKVYVEANNYISAFNGLYEYLKKYCRVQLSWCGNRQIKIDHLTMFDGTLSKTIVQKYRVYMNYCTLAYSMCWWDFTRWEKEIDFMAMNGINMPLAVVGSESVWYHTMLDMGLTKDEALSTISGPAFWPWHLMTNIEGYLPPQNESYVKEREELGKKIMARYIEFGMQPIEQGFSGHVPMLLKEKYKHSKIKKKHGWNMFSSTAQLDPLDPLFERVGMAYLNNMKKIFGNYHFFACDPFHEGTPPKSSSKYLSSVGRAIDGLYSKFDDKSVWVIQGWTPRKDIITAVPKDRMLILDISSLKAIANDNFWGYDVVSGMLHNFGGKNAMQGKIRHHADNTYRQLIDKGINVVGTGMFMEGIEQNPVVYDLQFQMLTESAAIDFNEWLKDYLDRRYGGTDENILKAWSILMDTCYSDKGYKENEVGSTIASRPQIAPLRAGPCCYVKPWYDTERLKEALAYFLKSSDKFGSNDGYQYDLCDITRQVLSNIFYNVELKFDKAYGDKDIVAMCNIAKSQLELLADIDELLSHRSEMCLSRWICDAKKLATSKDEEQYFELNARALITVWGDINTSYAQLYDYSWREWSGLIREYYYRRWQIFYEEVVDASKEKKKFKHAKSDNYCSRLKYRSTKFNRQLYKFEMDFVHSIKSYEYPQDSDVIPSCLRYVTKYHII